MQVSSLSLENKDRWVWKDDDCIGYTVKSTYGFLRGKVYGDPLSLYSYFWKIKALPSTHVTAWRVLENKIATKINLEKRGVVIAWRVVYAG